MGWNTALLSGLVAAAVAILVTVLVERFGGRIGGVIGTAPSTIIPASIGLWAVAMNAEDYARAMAPVPYGMLINALFLVAWSVVPRRFSRMPARRLAGFTTLISLTIWAAGAIGIILFFEWRVISSASPLVVGWLGLILLLGFGLLITAKGIPQVNVVSHPTATALLARGILAGLAIGTAVLLGQSGHVLLAGLASVFPAIFLTTMLALWWSHGHNLPASATGPMALGASSVALFALLTASLFPKFGVLTGVGISWAMAIVVCTCGSSYWLSTRPTLTQSMDP